MVQSIDVDVNFSVYHLVERVDAQTVLRHRRTMNGISYEIENATLIDGAATRIFSGFQRFSKFIPQVERYRRLAQAAESVYVFGIADATPPEIPNITYVPLTPQHQLAKEWFLVSYGADYFSALATEELTNLDDPDEVRMFKGIWTFDLRLISILEEWLSSTVNIPSMAAHGQAQNFTKQIQMMGSTIARMTRLAGVEQAPVIANEIKAAAKVELGLPMRAFAGEQALLAPSNDEVEDVVVLGTSLASFDDLLKTTPARAVIGGVLNPYYAAVSQGVQARGHHIEDFNEGSITIRLKQANVQEAVLTAQEIVRAIQAKRQEQRSKGEALGLPPVGVGIAHGQALIGQPGPDAEPQVVLNDLAGLAKRLSQAEDDDCIRLSLSAYELLAEKKGYALDGSVKPHRAYRMIHAS